eukprot:TRINITY_DN15126_c0_g1_i5.p1 TRINITY_DN15126_c0_g1~~TRINITY_DN15126_c0_g1_i5.p1  ORF type:complete len:193 (+),score=25.71 TRINITY_DN15126_c0_g1_i5:307-885(+)
MPGDLRWANTGDLGTVDERGYIWMFGRAKDTIVRGGHNIDPRMIEEVLVCHPSVQIAAAIGKPDAAKGEMPIAYVQFKDGHSASAEELLEMCRRDVQERAAVPVEIIPIPLIPMTAVGKINKPALRVDAMRRVASNVVANVIGENARYQIEVDESGLRPCVKIHIGAAPETTLSQLTDAFRTFEFLTRIENA